MSSSTENRWRTQPQQPGGRRERNSIQGLPPQSSPRSRNPPDPANKGSSLGPTTSQASAQPNAWTGTSERGRSASAAHAVPATPTPNTTTASSASASGPASTAAGSTAAASAAAAAETYTPVGGFNRDEVKDFMRKRLQEALAGDSEQIARWKPSSDSASVSKQGVPWGQKPTMMSNGSDFWVQLKKQVAAKEQGG